MCDVCNHRRQAWVTRLRPAGLVSGPVVPAVVLGARSCTHPDCAAVCGLRYLRFALPPCSVMPGLSPLPRAMACRIIAENFLEKWWQNLDETLATDKHVDTRSIHSIMA